MRRSTIIPNPSAERGGGARPETVTGPPGAPSHLLVDLDALASNWRALHGTARAGGAIAAGAAVKADAYGLGLARVAPTLAAAGCRHFFVAHAGEALDLRVLLPEAEIFMLHGPLGPEVRELSANAIVPVLNDLGQVARWRAEARRLGRSLGAAIHLDTGMNRLGLPAREIEALATDPGALDGIDLRLVMSHLATADEPGRPEAEIQRARFRALAGRLPPAPLSLANSAGVALGPDYAFDLVRPGIALYGGRPLIGEPNPMAEVVRLRGGILQVREIDAPGTVGYGATHSVTPGSRVATVAVGYADGLPRAAGHRRTAMLGGRPVPIVGRVSMDLITLDVTGLPEDVARPGALVDLIGGGVDIDDAAAAAGTIAYELLTSLGHRYARHYLGGA